MKLAENFNGADLRNVCTEAGMFAIRDERDYVTYEVRRAGAGADASFARTGLLAHAWERNRRFTLVLWLC